MRTTLTAIAALTCGLALVPSNAQAGAPAEVSGTMTLIGADADGNAIWSIEGDLEGTFTAYEGSGVADLLVCQCTAWGHGDDDTMVFRVVDPTSAAGEGSWVILDGTGVLSAFHARGVWAIDFDTLTGEYSGMGKFAPGHH